MVRLDSIKLKIPFGWFGIDPDYWRKLENTEPILRDSLISQPQETGIKYELKGKDHQLPIGINSLFINNEHGLIIELSAKVLRPKYFEGININTIEQVWDTLKKMDQLTLDSGSMEQTFILRCDSTHTLPIESTQSISSILIALSLAPTNIKYSAKDYKGESLIFNHKGSSKRERLILYDKLTELRKNSDIKFLSEALSKVDSNNGYLRVEANIGTTSDLRELFKVASTPYSGIKLLDALGSKENPTLKIYDKIMNANIPIEQNQLEFFLSRDEIQYFKTIPAHQFIKSVGMESILKKFNWDIKKIRTYLLDVLEYKKSRVSQLIKEFEFEKLRLENKTQFPIYLLEVVDQIRELLKVA